MTHENYRSPDARHSRRSGHGYETPLNGNGTAAADLGTTAHYGRVSGQEQKKNENIGTQVEIARNYSTLHGLSEPRLYLDDGVSGTIPLFERPEGRRLLDDAKAGRIKLLLLWRLNRLGRNTLDILAAVQQLNDLGVEVRSMTEPFDTSTPPGRLMFSMLAGFASFDRESMLENMDAGRKRSARENVWLGGMVPLGYRAEGEKRKARLVIDDRTVEVLGISVADLARSIFRWAAQERLSTIAIAGRLNAMSAPTPCELNRPKTESSRLWKQGTVYAILKNSTYIGVQRWGEGTHEKRGSEIIEQVVPALVDEQTWERAQAALDYNRSFSRRNAQRDYLLRGLIRCGNCGHRYTGVQRGQNRPYYICMGHNSPKRYGVGKTDCKWVRADWLEATVWEDIEGFLRKPQEVLTEIAAQQGEQAAEAEAAERRIGELNEELAATAEVRHAAIDLCMRKKITEEELDTQRTRLLRQDTATRAEIDRLRASIAGLGELQARLAAAEELLQRLGRSMDHPWSYQEKREAVEMLVERIAVETVKENGQAVQHVRAFYQFADDTTIATKANLPSCSSCTLPALTVERARRMVGRAWSEERGGGDSLLAPEAVMP